MSFFSTFNHDMTFFWGFKTNLQTPYIFHQGDVFFKIQPRYVIFLRVESLFYHLEFFWKFLYIFDQGVVFFKFNSDVFDFHFKHVLVCHLVDTSYYIKKFKKWINHDSFLCHLLRHSQPYQVTLSDFLSQLLIDCFGKTWFWIMSALLFYCNICILEYTCW